MKMARLTPPSVAFRHHGAPKAAVPEPEGDQSLRWWEQPLPLKEKKAELAPRISLDDLIALKDNVVVIDTRNEEEFALFPLFFFSSSFSFFCPFLISLL